MIDHENVEKFAQDHDVPFSNYASLTPARRRCRTLIRPRSTRVNAKFARVEQIKKFCLLETPAQRRGRGADADDEALERKLVEMSTPIASMRCTGA